MKLNTRFLAPLGGTIKLMKDIVLRRNTNIQVLRCAQDDSKDNLNILMRSNKNTNIQVLRFAQDDSKEKLNTLVRSNKNTNIQILRCAQDDSKNLNFYKLINERPRYCHPERSEGPGCWLLNLPKLNR